ASRTRHDVVRGDAARFVEEKDAGHKFGCVGPHPHAWPELTMSPQRSRYALGFGVEGEGPTPHLAELTMSPQRSRYALGFGVEGEGPTPHLAELTPSPQRSRYALGFGVEGEGPTPHLAELTMSPQRSRYATRLRATGGWRLDPRRQPGWGTASTARVNATTSAWRT